MINVSISYGVSEDNKYKLSSVPPRIQLSLYKYDIYKNLKNKIFKDISRGHVHVKATHLPIDSLRRDPKDIIEMINEIFNETGCYKFVIHPNKLIKGFLSTISLPDPVVQICVENFQWRRKKELRSPLEIIEFSRWFGNSVRLCLDTSHTEEIWFDYKLMSYLLPYTSVIHLSNRIGKKAHLPFNIQNGDLQLVGFVKELKKRYKWSGDIVLEYMGEYHHKLTKNYHYLKRLVE